MFNLIRTEDYDAFAAFALAMTLEFDRGSYGFYLYDELYYACINKLPLKGSDHKDLQYAKWYLEQKRKRK